MLSPSGKRDGPVARVRRARTSDAAAMDSLAGRYWKVDVDHLKEIGSKESVVLVAVDGPGGRVVGLVLAFVRRWNRTAYVAEIATERKLMGMGIGTMLVEGLAKRAVKLGLRAVIAETQPSNVRAMRFFAGRGFRLCGYDDRYYTNKPRSPKQVAVFYSLDLE